MTLNVEESAGVRSIIRSAGLRKHLLHFVKLKQYLTHACSYLRCILERNTHGQLCFNPKCPFIKMWQELRTKKCKAEKSKHQGNDSNRQAPDLLPENKIEDLVISN